jgi:hypothetical protein
LKFFLVQTENPFLSSCANEHGGGGGLEVQL